MVGWRRDKQLILLIYQNFPGSFCFPVIINKINLKLFHNHFSSDPRDIGGVDAFSPSMFPYLSKMEVPRDVREVRRQDNKHKQVKQNTDAPGSNNVKIDFDPAPPQGQVMLLKYEEPTYKLTVQVLWLSSAKLFKILYFVCKLAELYNVYGQMDRQTNERTDDPITRYPRRTFQGQD